MVIVARFLSISRLLHVSSFLVANLHLIICQKLKNIIPHSLCSMFCEMNFMDLPILFEWQIHKAETESWDRTKPVAFLVNLNSPHASKRKFGGHGA